MVTPELIAFIQDEMHKGTSLSDITSKLASRGWNQQDILSALNQSGSNTASVPTPPSSTAATTAGGQPGYYVSSVPAEKASEHPGQTEGIISIVFAVISLLLFPPVFGIAGIVLGVRAHGKGAKSLGTVGIVLSSICMILGVIFGIWVSTALHHTASPTGMVGGVLLPL